MQLQTHTGIVGSARRRRADCDRCRTGAAACADGGPGWCNHMFSVVSIITCIVFATTDLLFIQSFLRFSPHYQAATVAEKAEMQKRSADVLCAVCQNALSAACVSCAEPAECNTAFGKACFLQCGRRCASYVSSGCASPRRALRVSSHRVSHARALALVNSLFFIRYFVGFV
jgi:hypothetical protein